MNKFKTINKKKHWTRGTGENYTDFYLHCHFELILELQKNLQNGMKSMCVSHT